MERSHTNQEHFLPGRYRILAVLSETAGRTVYLAEDMELKVLRAIKCFSKTCSMRIQFYLEADLLQSLQDPFIPIFYDTFEDVYHFYLVEEYIEGESLEAYVLYHQISQNFLIKTGIDLCCFLEFLHIKCDRPVIYLDLKPEHIIVCGNGLKIIDYGTALYLTGKGKNCQNSGTPSKGISVHGIPGYGTPGYAAPEQYDAGKCVDQRTDIYGLGAVLSFLMRHSSQEVSGNLKKIIKKSRARKPEKRYQSATELKMALEQELYGPGKMPETKNRGWFLHN